MSTLREAAPKVALVGVLGAGSALGAAACSGSSGGANTLPSPIPKVTPVSAAEQQLAAPDCSVSPYGLADYISHDGANIMAPVGQLDNGTYKFTKNSVETSKDVAKALGPNDPALAVSYIILKAESGITPANVVQDAGNLYSKMRDNSSTRNTVCSYVVSRVLETPAKYITKYQSSTGYVVTYQPTYDAQKNLVGVDDPTTSNTDTINLFQIAPLSGSTEASHDSNLSDNWGYTADGQIIETSFRNSPNVHVALNGQPVNIKPSGEVRVAPTPTPSTAEHNNNQQRSNGGGGQFGPSGQHHEGNHTGTTPENGGKAGHKPGKQPSYGQGGGHGGGGNHGGPKPTPSQPAHSPSTPPHQPSTPPTSPSTPTTTPPAEKSPNPNPSGGCTDPFDPNCHQGSNAYTTYTLVRSNGAIALKEVY